MRPGPCVCVMPDVMLARATCERLPLADNSVDLIFTDPPYPKKYLSCYGWLAQEATRVLKPGGFVLAMCGGFWLDKIYSLFDVPGLKYFWQFRIQKTGYNPGAAWIGGKVPMTTFGKPIIGYSKGSPDLNKIQFALYDEYSSRTMPEKRYHHWGQEVGSASFFVRGLSSPGDLVVDPFIGGGTTAVACELIGRRCLGLDIDPAALATSAARLANADILHTMPLFA